MNKNLNGGLVTLALAITVGTAVRSAAAAPRVAGCVNVQDFLANPNDESVDAAPAIRTAIATALASGPRVVCLLGRTYKLLSTVGTTDVFDLSGATDLAIVGEGPATVLELGNLSATSIQVFDLASGSARIRFQDLVVDGTQQATATPASSLFKIGGGSAAVSDITLEAVQIVGAGGAGVAIAQSAVPTSGVVIHGSRFAANRGTALQMQGAAQVLVVANYFGDNLGLEIEALQGAALTGLTITNNVIDHAASTEPLAIRLSAPTSSNSLDATLADNVLVGGRVVVQRFGQVVIAGNIIAGGTHATSDPELLITGSASSITVTSNVFRRLSCTAGHIVQLGVAGDTLRTASVANNSIVQVAIPQSGQIPSCTTVGVSSPLQVAPASNVVISGNRVALAAAAPAITGIAIGPATTAFSYVNVANNSIAAVSLAAAIELGGGNGVAPLALVSDNVSRGAATGVQVDSTSVSSIPMITNNTFVGATTGIALTAAKPAVAVRGNFKGPLHLTGVGAPESHIVAPVGSLYFQTNATSGGLWVKQAGVGATGWIAKH